MCGHVGFAGNLTKKHTDAFKDLLVFDMVRGMHSTGVASVGAYANKEVQLLKQVGPAPDLFDHKLFDSINTPSKSVLIGHNRYATKGGVTKSNAHPFMVDDCLVGAHNGTVTLRALRKFEDEEDFDEDTFETDSELILNQIAKNGSKVLSQIYGAWALVWYDMRDKTLNVLRNSERTLYMAFAEDDEWCVWASEAWMIVAACERRGLKHKKIRLIAENTHFSWDIPDPIADGFKRPRARQVEPAKDPLTTRSGGTGYNNVYRGHPQNNNAQTNRQRAAADKNNVKQTTKVSDIAKEREERRKAREAAKEETRNPKSVQEALFGDRDKLIGRSGKTRDKSPLTDHVSSSGTNLTEDELSGILKNAACINCDITFDVKEVINNPKAVKILEGDNVICEDCVKDPALTDTLNAMGARYL